MGYESVLQTNKKDMLQDDRNPSWMICFTVCVTHVNTCRLIYNQEVCPLEKLDETYNNKSFLVRHKEKKLQKDVCDHIFKNSLNMDDCKKTPFKKEATFYLSHGHI